MEALEPQGDPFADVEPDAGLDLPPGVEAGSLGGVDLTEEQVAADALPDPETETTEEEPEPVLPEPTLPEVEPEPVELGDTPEEPVEEPQELGQPEPTPTEGEWVEEFDPAAEAAPEPATEVEGTETAEEPPAEEPKAEKPKKPRKKASKKKAKGGPDDREYVILVKGGPNEGVWEQQDETVKARNGNIALRRAYRLLTEDSDAAGEFTIVATPVGYFRPKTVNGRVHKQTAITIS